MAYPKNLYAVAGEHRFHDHLNTIALHTAILFQSLAREAAQIDDHALLGCKIHSMDVVIPLYNRVRIATNYGIPAVLDFRIIDRPPPPLGWTSEDWTTQGFQDLTWSVIKGQFVLGVEPWLEWVRASLSSDPHQWPPITNFSRVVRNAIVHGGTINISNPNAPIVSWEGRSYGPNDLGRKIFHDDIGHGDLLVLLCTLSEELNDVGAPLTPP